MWTSGDASLEVSYALDPGSDLDGTAVHVPVAVLNQLDADESAWGVEGMRSEVVEAAVRTLPKDIRRQLIPLAETLRAVLDTLGPPAGPLPDALARAVTEVSGVRVRPADIDLTRIDDHLRVTFVVHTADGRVLGAGKDLAPLRRTFGRDVRAALLDAFPGLEVSGATAWQFGDLAPVLEAEHVGMTVRAFPAIVDDDTSVSLRVLSSAALQQRVTPAGERRLLALTSGVTVAHLERQLTNASRLAIPRAGLDQRAFLDDCLLAVVDRILSAAGGVVWTAAEFEALRVTVRQQAPGEAAGAVPRRRRSCPPRSSCTSAWTVWWRTRSPRPSTTPALTSTASCGPGSCSPPASIGWRMSIGTSRGVARRLDRLGADVARDRRAMLQVQELERRYTGLMRAGASGPDVVAVGWALEELRISLFAQTLGTSGPVSATRIGRELARLG